MVIAANTLYPLAFQGHTVYFFGNECLFPKYSFCQHLSILKFKESLNLGLN